MEQRYTIKFCVKLQKTKQETYAMLKDAYGDEQMSKATFYRWLKRFYQGYEQVKDEPRSGAPKNARKEENIQEVKKIVLKDRRSSVRMISEAVGISVGTADNSDQRSETPESLCQVSAEDPLQGPETVSCEMFY